MKAELTFLGTAGESLVYAKQLLCSGGFVLRYDDVQFVIDPGPGALVYMKMNDVHVRETTSIFVSHNHINHCNDVNAIVMAMTYNGLDKKGVLVSTDEFVESNPDYFNNLFEKRISLKADQKIGISNVDIVGLKAEHGGEALGFKFMFPEFNLIYSGDTGYFSDMDKLYAKADVLVLNVQNPKGVKSKNRLNVDDALNIIEKVKPKVAYITHFGLKLFQDDLLNVSRELTKGAKCQVTLAKSGMNVNLFNFISKQKSLKGF